MRHWWHQLSSEQHKCCKTLIHCGNLCRVTFLHLGSLANDAGLNIFQICLVSQNTKHCFGDSPREPCSALLASFQFKVAKSWKAAQLYNNLDKLIPQCNRFGHSQRPNLRNINIHPCGEFPPPSRKSSLALLSELTCLSWLATPVSALFYTWCFYAALVFGLLAAFFFAHDVFLIRMPCFVSCFYSAAQQMEGRARDSIYTTAGLSLVSGVSQLLCLLYNTTFCNNYFFVGSVIVIDLRIGFPIHECKSQTQ